MTVAMPATASHGPEHRLKKHPATGDGVKVREETPKGKITPAREMDHAAIPPAEV